MIVGDFNIHADDTTDSEVKRLLDIINEPDLMQNAQSATHRFSHILDLVLTRSDFSVSLLPSNPPLLSEHAFIVADFGCDLPGQSNAITKVRRWYSLDVDAITRDLIQSDISCALHTW